MRERFLGIVCLRVAYAFSTLGKCPRLLQEVLNPTVASSRVAERVNHWRVVNEYAYSDRALIQFSLGGPQYGPVICRRKTIFFKFPEFFSQEHGMIYDETMEVALEYNNGIDNFVHKLEKVMTDTYGTCCPKRSVRGKGKKCVWWNRKLAIIRRKQSSSEKFFIKSLRRLVVSNDHRRSLSTGK